MACIYTLINHYLEKKEGGTINDGVLVVSGLQKVWQGVPLKRHQISTDANPEWGLPAHIIVMIGKDESNKRYIVGVDQEARKVVQQLSFFGV